MNHLKIRNRILIATLLTLIPFSKSLADMYSGGGGGLSSVTGDGTVLNTSAPAGALGLKTQVTHAILNNATAGTAAPTFTASPTITGLTISGLSSTGLVANSAAGALSTTNTPGSSTILTTISAQHHLGGGTAPSIAAGAGGDATATVTLTGGSNDTDGQISVVAAGVPGASAVICTVTFGTTYTTQPFAVIYPSNATASLLTGASAAFVNTSATTLTLNVGTVPLVAGSTYTWQYVVFH